MDPTLAFPLLVALVGVALLFDFLNGLHDAANSIATVVSTRVLRPQIAVALVMVFVVAWLFVKANPRFADMVFRRLQLVSAAAYSLGHGGNDAQKTMGIIAVLLYSQGMLGDTFYVPLWVVLTCQPPNSVPSASAAWQEMTTQKGT